MGAHGDSIPEYEQQILAALTDQPMRTPEAIRAIPGNLRNHYTTAENYLHRMAAKGKIVREKVVAPKCKGGYYFTWRKVGVATCLP